MNIFISKNKKLFYLTIIVALFLVSLIIGTIALTGQKTIELILEYKSGTIFDPDDNGIETIGNLIDLTVENSAFNWQVDYNKVCTKWDIQSSNKKTALCYGGEECCKSLSLSSVSNNWGDTFYLDYELYSMVYDIGYSSLISAQIFYVDNRNEGVIYSEVKSLDANFVGDASSEIIESSQSSSAQQSPLIQGMAVLTKNNKISFNEVKDCKTEYWEEEEPVYGICYGEYKKTICDDPPINISCHDEITYYNYSCIIGKQKVQKSKEVCEPKELRIIRNNEEGRINFGNWGKCSTAEENNELIVICDSRYDGNNDGICQSGESCVKFRITEQGVERYLKNSREDFTEEDESFFLEKLDYEVMSR